MTTITVEQATKIKENWAQILNWVQDIKDLIEEIISLEKTIKGMYVEARNYPAKQGDLIFATPTILVEYTTYKEMLSNLNKQKLNSLRKLSEFLPENVWFYHEGNYKFCFRNDNGLYSIDFGYIKN